MEITITTLAEHVVIKPIGRFDAHEADKFRGMVTPVLAPDADIVVDLSSVAFIDSTALAELVRLSRKAEESGCRMVLREPSVPVKVILELTGLDMALPLEKPTVAESP